jgi:hypothetical protein
MSATDSVLAKGLLSVAGLLAIGAFCLLLGFVRWWLFTRGFPSQAAQVMAADPWDPTKDPRITAALMAAMTLLGGLLVALAVAVRR